jgi:hypothetical protein
VKLYHPEALRDGVIIAASRSIVLPDLAAVWREIAKLSRTVDGPCGKIRVKDEAGRIVVLVGAAAARPCADAGL